MDLTGKIILDTESKMALKEEIRQEVIDDIAENGNYGCEIEQYLNKCNFEHYYERIANTLPDLLERVDEEKEVRFGSERKKLDKLKLIQQIIEL